MFNETETPEFSLLVPLGFQSMQSTTVAITVTLTAL